MTLSWGIPACFAACNATLRNGFWVHNAFAPESFNWKANSSAVYPGFAGETMPPAQCVPHIIAGVSTQLGVKSASTSPFCHSQTDLRPLPKFMAVSLTWA